MHAGRHLNFPFDEEVFNYSWKNTPDLFLDNVLKSGAVQRDSEIARLISQGSNAYVVPFYDELGGEDQVYDGIENFDYTSLSGDTYRGVVYGRMKAWDAISFIKDFNSGADPMGQIVAGVANYWQKRRQARFINLVKALFEIDGGDEWAEHSSNISKVGNVQKMAVSVTHGTDASKNIKVKLFHSALEDGEREVQIGVDSTSESTTTATATTIKTALNNDAKISALFTVSNTDEVISIVADAVMNFDSGMKLILSSANGSGVTLGASSDTTEASTVGDDNKVSATSLGNLIVQANGDNSDGYTLAIMHSKIANDLANLQMLQFGKYTDPQGIMRDLNLAYINGMLVIVNDGVTVGGSSVKGQKEYSTYLLGNGAFKYETAPVARPVELDRDPKTRGGVDMLYTRVRETFAPYGFSYDKDVSNTADVGVKDDHLLDPDNWTIKMPKKSILMSRLISN